jgi:hypothetical protein
MPRADSDSLWIGEQVAQRSKTNSLDIARGKLGTAQRGQQNRDPLVCALALIKSGQPDEEPTDASPDRQAGTAAHAAAGSGRCARGP